MNRNPFQSPVINLGSTSTSRRAVLGGILGGAAVWGLAACGSDGGSSGSSVKLPPKFSPGADPEAWETAYEEVIQGAMEEGELVAMFGATTAAAEEQIRDEFAKRYGIKFTLVPGSTDEVTNRVLAEASQGVHTVDLAAQGPSGIERVVAAGILAPLMPELIIPDVVDRSKDWRVDYVPWTEEDVEGKYVTYYGLNVSRNVSRIYYNTSVSKEDVDSVKSWQDFLDPKWKGRLAIYDISEAAAATRTATWTRLGKDYWQQLMETQDVAVWADGADTNFTNSILNGDQEVALVSGGAEGAMIDAIDQGLPIAEWPITLEEGSAAAFQGLLGILANAPHPNAAKLYINWLLSKEGATVYNALTNKPLVHLRSDVPQGSLSDELWDRANNLDISLLEKPNSPEYRQESDDATAFWTGIYEELGITPAA
jgi:ABC-type Fe3+ transport system substrate-binding protein